MNHFVQAIIHLFVPHATGQITVEASVDNAVFDLKKAALNNAAMSKLLEDTLRNGYPH